MCITDIKDALKEARRLRDNTSVKINDYKKKGKDTTELEKQLQEYRNQVNELTAKEKQEKEAVMNRVNKKADYIITSPKEAENVTKIAIKLTRKMEKKLNPVQPYDLVGTPGFAMIPKGEQKQLKEQAAKAKAKSQSPKSWKKTEMEACERTMNRILEDNDWHQGYQFRASEWMDISHLRTIVLPDSVELEYTIRYKTRNHRVEKTVTKYFNPNTVQSLNKYIEHVELWVMLNSGDMDNKDIVFGARFNMVQFEKQGFKEAGWIIYK